MRRLLVVLLALSQIAARPRDRMESVPALLSLLYSNMPTEYDSTAPPGVAATGRRRDTLRIRWGGCEEGAIRFYFQPITEFETRLRELRFRRVECVDATDRVVDSWVLGPAPASSPPSAPAE